MLTLATSNAAKYAPLAATLQRLRLELEPPPGPMPELQLPSFGEALEAKAKAANALFQRPVLVDDAGLVLEAYPGFPGPLTSAVLRGIGAAGLRRLLDGCSLRAAMECHLGIWLDGTMRKWSGRAEGLLDFSRRVSNPRMLLSDLFVPDSSDGELPHRALALAALEKDAFELHLAFSAAQARPAAEVPCPVPSTQCPFCAEFENDGLSIYAEMMGSKLPSRIVYEDEDFIIMPPLGEFIEGGLLLLSRAHIPSFAYLAPKRLERLERLLAATCAAVEQRWGVRPLVFEHGPAAERSKGVCCVDHAHLNLFPARVHLHPHVRSRMHCELGAWTELPKVRNAEFGYLCLQENDRTLRAYDGEGVPTQLVRRIITQELGIPERWHWRDYPGQAELIATYEALKGQIRM